MQEITFSSRNYRGLAIFVHRQADTEEASVTLFAPKGKEARLLSSSSGYLHFDLREETEFRLVLEHAALDLAYLDTGADMLCQGVFPLYGSGNRLDPRNKFHFAPMEGWMNDPNGLCVFQGKMHLFYQYHPYGQVWGNMHWGHAVSSDLLHWIHQPVAFFPQPELQDQPTLRGGAFSGCAVADDALTVFFTRNVGDQARSWRIEKQVMAKSEDGIAFGEEHVVLEQHIPSCSGDFRDPKVLPYGDGYLMVVASCVEDKPTVLLYRSKHLETWEFVSFLYQEMDPKYAVAECPDFFFLDGFWVLIVGYLNRNRSPVRDVKYLVGSFDGREFVPVSSGLVDEGKDFYATQSMEWKGRRILFGWNSDTEGIYQAYPLGANGTLSLPRELSVRNQSLVQTPFRELATLRQNEAPRQGEPARLWVSGNPITSLEGALSPALVIRYRSGLLEVLVEGRKRCSLLVEDLHQLEGYADTALLELFVNEGARVVSVRHAPALAPISLKVEGNDIRRECNALRSVWR